jgi:hypothetical protein
MSSSDSRSGSSGTVGVTGVEGTDVRFDSLVQKERREARVLATGEPAMDCSSEGEDIDRSEDEAYGDAGADKECSSLLRLKEVANGVMTLTSSVGEN